MIGGVVIAPTSQSTWLRLLAMASIIKIYGYGEESGKGLKVVIGNVSVKEGEGMIRIRTGGRVQIGLYSGV